MANEREQKLYNEALRETQSLNKMIASSLDDISNKSDKRNKLLQDELSLAKEILNSVEKKEDIDAAINLITQQRNNINQSSLGINEKYKNQVDAILTSGIANLQNLQSQEEILAKVSKKVDDVANNFDEMVDNLIKSAEDIPLIGGLLTDNLKPKAEEVKKIFSKTADIFTSNFMNAFKNTSGGWVKQFSAGLNQGTKAASNFASKVLRLLGPIGIIGSVLAAGLVLGFQAFKSLEAAAKAFRDETGLLISQTSQMNLNIRQSFRDTNSLGASMEDVAKAAGEFVTEFDGIEQPAQSTLSSLVTLNKNFGISTKEASQLNKIFQNIGGLSQQQSQFLVGQTAEMAKMAGVAPSKVIKDIADNSESAYKFFGGSPQALAKAAVQAAKLGTSIKEAASVASTLLDYESSVSKELEASAILGTNLNLSRARQLAAENDIVGAQQEVISQLNDIGDISKLNTFEKEALVAATGMELESLVNQQRITQKFGKLDNDRLAAANKLLETGKDISEISAQDLKNQTALLATQKGLQDDSTRLKNAFGEIGDSLKNAFMPLAEFVIPILADVGEILGDVLVPILNAIGGIFKFIQIPLSFIFAGFLDIVKFASKLFRYLVDGLFQPLYDVNVVFSNILNHVSEFGQSIDNIMANVQNFFSSMGNFLSGGVFSTLGIAPQTQSEVTAVNDAVISPEGGIISTSPEDYLIATKDPSSLANSSGTNMEAVVNELKSLKQAFLSNKDVYMDTVKVSSQVSRASEKSSDNIFGLGVS